MTKDLDEFYELLGSRTIDSIDKTFLHIYWSMTVSQLARMRDEPGTTESAKQEINIVIREKRKNRAHIRAIGKKLGISSDLTVEEACDSG